MTKSSRGCGAEPSLSHPEDSFTPTFVSQLSPRSLEACRRCGVLPEELIVQPCEAFFDPNLEPEMWKLRYTEHDALRHETLGECRRMRKEVVRQRWRPPSDKGEEDELDPYPLPDEKEKKRVAREVQRQNRDLQVQMEQEVRYAAWVKANREKEEARKRAIEEAERQKEEERKEISRRNRQMQQLRKQREEEEEGARMELAREIFESEKRVQEDMNRRELERQKENEAKAKRTADRLEKAKRLKEKNINEKKKAALKRLKDMEERDKKRQRDLEAKKRQMDASASEKALDARVRVRMVRDQSERALEKKREKADKRQEDISSRLRELDEETSNKIAERQMAMEERQLAREARVLQKRAEQEARAVEVADKHHKAAAYLESKKRENNHRDRMKSELSELNQRRKAIMLERQERRDMYASYCILNKNYELTRKQERAQRTKHAKMLERQRNDQSLREQKRHLQSIFDNYTKRTDWVESLDKNTLLLNTTSDIKPASREGQATTSLIKASRSTPALL